MAKLKSGWFGYSKDSVKTVLAEQKRDYEAKIQTLTKKIDEFQKTIERYKSNEKYMAEALTDAKRVAHDILTDTEYKADEYRRKTEVELTERVNQIEEELQYLDEVRQAVVNHENYVKIELSQVLRHHLELIEHLNVTNFQNSNEEVLRRIQEAQSRIATSRSLILEGQNVWEVSLPEDESETPVVDFEDTGR